MTAVVNRGAGLRGIVHGAEVLPFASAHLWTGRCGARFGGVTEQTDNDSICLLNEEAAELVEPDVTRGVWGRSSKFFRDIGSNRLDRVAVGGMGVRVMKCFQVFGQLEGRIELSRSVLAQIELIGDGTGTDILQLHERRPFSHIL